MHFLRDNFYVRWGSFTLKTLHISKELLRVKESSDKGCHWGYRATGNNNDVWSSRKSFLVNNL